MSPRIPCTIAAATPVVCASIVLLRVLYTHDLWENASVINWLVAWIPFVISVLLAFLPDKEMEPATRIKWRVAVIACGLGYSMLLWHQQTLTQQLAAHDQALLLGNAVDKSNQHSDKQIENVRKDIKGDLAGKASKADLAEMANKITDRVGRSTSDINASIGKVNKPEPPELARLQFTLWKAGISNSDLPILSRSISEEKDGTIPVDFSFTNISSTAATELEIIVSVCGACSFASEPAGFEKLKGSSDFQRHRRIGDINPGITYEEMTVSVKVPEHVSEFEVGFNYACKTCGKALSEGWQKARISVVP